MYARQLWQRLETLHAVTYFADESVEAARSVGLKGFWMGYFGFRAAPLGAVTAATVEATFANFAPAMVERSIPDAWTYAEPGQLIEVRRLTAAAALRRMAPDVDAAAARANAALEAIVAAASPLGRPLFTANARLPTPTDAVERLWQEATALREHRGDGHLHALGRASIDGCEAHLLHAAEHGTPDEVLKPNRGWTDDAWAAARERLVGRGLLDPAGRLTETGIGIRQEIEAETDRLAAVPIDSTLSEADQRELLGSLTATARAVAGSDTIPFPNPMGLPALDQ